MTIWYTFAFFGDNLFYFWSFSPVLVHFINKIWQDNLAITMNQMPKTPIKLFSRRPANLQEKSSCGNAPPAVPISTTLPQSYCGNGDSPTIGSCTKSRALCISLKRARSTLAGREKIGIK
jgi:hypothetical protein